MSDRKSTTALSDEDDLLISDQNAVADQEARNGLLQFDEVLRLVALHAAKRRIEFSGELICDLNRLAVEKIRRSAGFFRLIPITITHTSHEPPAPEDVPQLVDEMCNYVNDNWDEAKDEAESGVHIAAYLMWRLNWIHPFRDGNGRTSRAVSYLALSVRLGRELGGTPTIADQIVDCKQPYYDALDAADAAWAKGRVDLSMMEDLIVELLTKQLSSIEDD